MTFGSNVIVRNALGKIVRILGGKSVALHQVAGISLVVREGDAEAAGAKFGKSIGAESLQALRAKSAEDLLKASASGNFTPVGDVRISLCY